MRNVDKLKDTLSKTSESLYIRSNLMFLKRCEFFYTYKYVLYNGHKVL